jgi:signal transduction histidine kinase
MLEKEIPGALNDNQREYINDINRSGDYLLAVMSDIIDLSAIELGQLELTLSDVSLRHCIAACHRLVLQRARDREVSIEIADMESIPSIIADERRIKQVILIILTNAIKF